MNSQISMSKQQCPLLAPLACSLQMGCVGVGVGVGMEWTWSKHYIGISTYQFIPCYASAIHKHAHILKPFEDSKLTGLKADIAK